MSKHAKRAAKWTAGVAIAGTAALAAAAWWLMRDIEETVKEVVPDAARAIADDA